MAFAFCQAKKVVDIRLCCSLLVRFANRHTALAARRQRQSAGRRRRRRNAPSALCRARCTAAIMHDVL